jgi:transcriptional regulator with XRE-family HTH domain
MSLTEHLIAARKRAALSQGEVAEALGVSRQAVSRWENGLALPSTDNLARLSRLYGISIDMLLDYRSDPTVDFPQATVPTTQQRSHIRWIILALSILCALLAITTVVLSQPLRKLPQRN